MVSECEHASEVRQRVVRGGAVQYVTQCTRCGEALGGPLPHARIAGHAPPFDEGLRDAFRAARRDARRADWLAWYADYLASAAWKERRERVLARAGGVCEGCGKAPATQVHHLHYARVGCEMLFDLVAVCDGCHPIVHVEPPAIL